MCELPVGRDVVARACARDGVARWAGRPENAARRRSAALADQLIVRVGPVCRQAQNFCGQRQSEVMPAAGPCERTTGPTAPATGTRCHQASRRSPAPWSRPRRSREGRISGIVSTSTPSAALSFISRSRSPPTAAPRAASACSTRPRHSSSNDRCIHSGTAAAASATPIDASPAGEKAQSSAARRLSICAPVVAPSHSVDRPPYPFGFGPLEQVAVVFRMAAREPFALAAFDKLLERIGACRVEQPVAHDGAVDCPRRRAIWRPGWTGRRRRPAARCRRPPRPRGPPPG